MKFTAKTYLKFLIPIPIIFGIFLLFYINQQEVSVWLTITIAIFFFGLPYATIINIKEIEYKNGQWLIRYPFRKKTITFKKVNVLKIEIIENIQARYVPNHTQINIRIKDGSSVYINSMETKEFRKILSLIREDFNGLIENRNFYG